MQAAATIEHEPGVGLVERFPIEPGEDTLLRLFKELFETHWDKIVFGSLVQGAVFEIRAPAPPQRVALFDGYLTVDFGGWHFHMCIGAHKGTSKNPTDEALARWRRCARAEFFRIHVEEVGGPVSWGLRFFNGRDEQQMTVFLPNPFLGPDDKVAKTPDWSRLDLWDSLRRDYLGLGPDALDRKAKRFWHP